MSSAVPVNSDYQLGFHKPENYVYKANPGLSPDVVKNISRHKNEAEWLTKFRLKSLEIFSNKHLPAWGGDLSQIDFSKIHYYIKPTEKSAGNWEELPKEIKNTYDKIGVPEAEKKYLAGVSAQYESEIIYKSILESLRKKGVIFVDPETAFSKYREIFKPYFGTIIPPLDNKFAALNSAVFSGGSFIYVPKGVHVDLPLQAYFRINAAQMGQF
ncbi:MAG: Fe-S cluster assembly protein SufB, partial [Patescibacteria group bacterium]|nr:Fe-S cluster assembly protein SufB [Patescibacteria group bacterium]